MHRLPRSLTGMLLFMTLAALGLLVRIALAQTTIVTIPGVVHYTPDGLITTPISTQYVLTTQFSGTTTFTETYRNEANDIVLVRSLSITGARANNFYVEHPGLPLPYTGTLTIDADQPFSAFVLGPTVDCPLTGVALTGDCRLIFVPEGVGMYSVSNTINVAAIFTHTVYLEGVGVSVFTDTLAVNESRTYQITRPSPGQSIASHQPPATVLLQRRALEAPPVSMQPRQFFPIAGR